jgi:hypothetical protein
MINCANMNCNGKGDCLEQTELNSYIKSTNVSCIHDCRPVKCPNYDICGTISPQWYFDCHAGTCRSCALSGFKFLEFLENIECEICSEMKKGVKQPNCSHTTCVDCFKRFHKPPYWDDPQPEFPYSSDIESEYDENQNDRRWLNDPLIQKYKRDIDNWFNTREENERNESYLKKCPFCRQ